MAGTVADYLVLKDKAFSLKDTAGSDTRRFKFSLPGRLHVGEGSSHMGILSFGLYDAQGDAQGKFEFDISLNGNEIYTGESVPNIELSKSDRSIQEAFKGTCLKTQDNELTLQIRRGSGHFHDLIIWFQRDT
jgi:hypothetical protein